MAEKKWILLSVLLLVGLSGYAQTSTENGFYEAGKILVDKLVSDIKQPLPKEAVKYADNVFRIGADMETLNKAYIVENNSIICFGCTYQTKSINAYYTMFALCFLAPLQTYLGEASINVESIHVWKYEEYEITLYNIETVDGIYICNLSITLI